jgi:hypothetical protein
MSTAINLREICINSSYRIHKNEHIVPQQLHRTNWFGLNHSYNQNTSYACNIETSVQHSGPSCHLADIHSIYKALT